MARSDQKGSSEALGLVLLTPVLLAAAITVFWISRLVDTQSQVHTVAEAAAQAAALQRDRVAADTVAREMVAATLVRPEVCADLSLLVDLGEFGPGGKVVVEIVCRVIGRGRESIIASPREIRARAVAGIDPFREVGAGSVHQRVVLRREIL